MPTTTKPTLPASAKPAPPGGKPPAPAPAPGGKPAAPARPGGGASGPSAPLAAKGVPTGKKLGKLGIRTVGDWTELATADGVPYFHNTRTGALTWDKPDEMKDKGELASEQGNWVWVPDERLGFAVAQLRQKRPDGRYEVTLEATGENITTKKGEPVYPLVKSSLRRLERDLVLLDSLDEGLILYNIRERFMKERQIYTNIGTILISVNPYETYPIYTTEKIYEYRQRGNRVLDPHVFTVADEALTPLLEYGAGENHSILISGESGAGKTWNTKQALSYLTEVTSRKSGGSSKVEDNKSSIEGRILAANPILEGFGNAKTVRNDNSSRFGRFTEVHFEKTGRIHGAKIDNFLLEKSRVVHQAGGERNYHVFYQLTKTPEWARKFGLASPDKYKYLSATGVYDVPDVDDAADFQTLLQAFAEMGITDAERDWVFELVAGVLHIGNVEFQPANDGEGSALSKKGQDAMKLVAQCLQCDPAEIEHGFTHRSIEVNKQVTKIPLKPHDAASSRDALAKSIYGQLFDWLVSRVNVALNGSPQPWAFIGLLDIFGFEIFKSNSFEQLCINFTNEKLQQLFNRDTFQKEQAMYRKEGVEFEEIQFIDNQPILDMIERKAGGLLATLDDLNRMPKSTDEQFVGKADEAHSQSPYYINSTNTRQGKAAFTIRHYAGDVVYDANGFLVKNKDLLFADLYDTMSRSARKETAAMFPAMDNNQRAKYSLGQQFRQQLDRLMTRLNATQSHYIRCIKPNNDKAARQMDAALTLEQLRYSGVFEAVRIRKQGFPFRYEYPRFVDRYKCLLLKDAKWVPLQAKNPKDQTVEILQSTGQDFSEIRMGATMALYRSEQHRLLELLRALALEKVCAVIQAVGRGMIARGYVRRFRAVIPRLENAIKSRDVDTIEKAIADYQRVLGAFATFNVSEPAVLRKCKRIRFALKEWEKLAVEADDLCRLDLMTDDYAFERVKDISWAMDELLDEPGTEWHMQMYDYVKSTFEETRFNRMDPKLSEAMNLLERELMGEVYAECKRLKLEDPRLGEIEKFMGLGEEDLLKYQYRNAKKLGMADRAREKEITIRERFLTQHQDMFTFERYPRLRDPEMFASASMQFWKREEMAASMLHWTKSVVNTSLTVLDPPLPKTAIQIHRSILGWCGDKNNPSPNSLAHEIVAHGIHTPELRDEIFALLMKQLSRNESPQSVAQAWKLFALCLQFFPPSTDFANYVLIFFRRYAPQHLKDRYRDALYDREYAQAATVPPEIDEIPGLVAGW